MSNNVNDFNAQNKLNLLQTGKISQCLAKFQLFDRKRAYAYSATSHRILIDSTDFVACALLLFSIIFL